MSAIRCVVLASVLLAAGCGEADAPPSEPKAAAAVPVETVVATVETLGDRAESVGTLRGNESVTLTAKLTEQVSGVYFEGGELVRAGDVLVELIDAEQMALLREAEAKLRESRLQLERLQTLGSDIAPAADVDVARARVDGNAALLEALRSRIDDRTIRAPFDGIIGFRQISLGALLTPGAVIADLDDIDPMKLDFSLPEHYLSKIAVGDEVVARSTAWSDESFAGSVTQIGSRIDPVTRAFSVRALVDNSDMRLRPGMLMTVAVRLGESPGIVIPETALMQSGAQSTVYTVDEAGIARRAAVTLGRRLPGSVEILEGLDAGVRVVSSGQLTLRPGVAVREVKAEETSLPAQGAVGE